MSVPAPLLEHARTAWRPDTARGPGRPDGSRLAGTPWISEGESHPACPHCGRPLQLFLQLDTADLPPALEGAFGDGLIQLFYCVTDDPQCDVECGAWEPFADSVVARLMPRGPGGLGLEAEGWAPHQILGWHALEDVPNTEEAETTLDVDLTDEEREQAWASDVPHTGDKLAGWPAWIQGVEYPSCPQCGSRMRLVFQLDSGDFALALEGGCHIPYSFGDAGIAHLTQCPKHHDMLAFGWACG